MPQIVPGPLCFSRGLCFVISFPSHRGAHLSHFSASRAGVLQNMIIMFCKTPGRNAQNMRIIMFCKTPTRDAQNTMIMLCKTPGRNAQDMIIMFCKTPARDAQDIIIMFCKTPGRNAQNMRIIMFCKTPTRDAQNTMIMLCKTPARDALNQNYYIESEINIRVFPILFKGITLVTFYRLPLETSGKLHLC